MILQEAMIQGRLALEQSGADSPRLTAELFLAEVLKMDRAFLLGHDLDPVSNSDFQRYWRLIKRRVAGEPTAYILGWREFYGLDFRVDSSVLVPRPETEFVVEWGLELLESEAENWILDVGVGSACILSTLLVHLPQSRGIGVDLSLAAAQTAKKNLAHHKLGDRSSILVSNLAGAVRPPPTGFQLITNNPPYILQREAPRLSREVFEHEPHLALFCSHDEDPFEAVRELAHEASSRLLSPGGVLLVEAAAGRHHGIVDTFQQAGLEVLGVRDDLLGIPRVVAGRKPSLDS